MEKNEGLSEALMDEKVSHKTSARDKVIIAYGGFMIVGLLIFSVLVVYGIIPMCFSDSYFNFMNVLSSIFAYIIAALLFYNFVLMIISLFRKKTKHKYASGIILRNIIITLLAVTIISVNVITLVYYIITTLSFLFVIVLWLDSSKN
ncbi:MAG: hypothetical protein KKH92_04835 [Firmicutes bacterium]|nr:hypothetical protein [Bacillota bacterium]